MKQDTKKDRTDQADTNQKSACGKPESEKQEAPRLCGKRSADSSEIVHTVLGSLEDYLHKNPPDYRFQVESLLVSIPWLQSHSIRYREPSIPNDRAT